ncbi:alpha/beta fold hydrolase [Roseospira goensis]|uniref:Lysophospholipase n=1 Tax=Roseospira goensis TaxID=391922 RepID=A0A7W6RZ13_9PROT|nr:alpha/beta hydrolase [Roseospira goensis]MBB4285340.1 lysophospholipase [Roseospira goensis]
MDTLPSIDSTGGQTLWVTAPDGAELRAARWLARGPRRGVVLLFNGRTEFIEKHLALIDHIRAQGWTVWTLDWRGQGLSPRPLPDRHKGHIDRFETYLADADALLESRVGPDVGDDPLVLVGHSMGGHLALRLLARQPARFAGVVLSAPMVGIHHGCAPAWVADALTAAAIRRGRATDYVAGGERWTPERERFEGNVVTHDPDAFQAGLDQIAANPDLALGGATWGWVRAARASIATLERQDWSAVTQPVGIALASEERIVSNRAIRRLAERLPNARLVEIEGACHEIYREADPMRGQFLALLDAVLEAAAPAA